MCQSAREKQHRQYAEATGPQSVHPGHGLSSQGPLIRALTEKHRRLRTPPCLASRGASDPFASPGPLGRDPACSPLLAAALLAALRLVRRGPLTICLLQHQATRVTSNQPLTTFGGLELAVSLLSCLCASGIKAELEYSGKLAWRALVQRLQFSRHAPLQPHINTCVPRRLPERGRGNLSILSIPVTNFFLVTHFLWQVFPFCFFRAVSQSR